LNIAQHALKIQALQIESKRPVEPTKMRGGHNSKSEQVRSDLAKLKAGIVNGMSLPQLAKKHNYVETTLFRHLRVLLNDGYLNMLALNGKNRNSESIRAFNKKRVINKAFTQ
jgi:hypothetical protein